MSEYNIKRETLALEARRLEREIKKAVENLDSSELHLIAYRLGIETIPYLKAKFEFEMAERDLTEDTL